MTDQSIDLLTERLASMLTTKNIAFDAMMLRQHVSSSLSPAATLGFYDPEQIVQLLELPFLIRRHGEACELLQLAVGAVMMRRKRSPAERLDFVHNRVLTRPTRVVDASALNLLRILARPGDPHEQGD